MSEPLWRPSAERVAQANVTRFMEQVRGQWGAPVEDYASLHRWSVERPEQFWQSLWEFGGIVASRRGATVLEHGDRMPGARWFPGARLNYAENLLRRRDDTPALIFRAEDRVERSLSWRELHQEVSRLAQALRAAGIASGDRVVGYMPNMPETIVAMLAATSIGATWASCSPDFGVQGAVDRFGQIEPRILLSTEGYYYNGRSHDILPRLPQIAAAIPSLEHILVVPYTRPSPDIGAVPHGRMLEEFVAGFEPREDIEFEQVSFDHPLYIMFSSGTTGVPKCIVHGVGGTLIQHIKEHRLHADIKPGDRLFYFTTCGWMMWNWLASALASEATLLLYDGSPFHPDGNVLFDYADAANMAVFGTSAKYIDAVRKAGLVPRESHDLSSVRTILSTGSPLVPESFDFVYESIKRDVCLSSISGGTDLIACFIIGCPVLPVYRGEIQCRALGMKVEVFDENGGSLQGEKGELVCTAPFPSMPVGFWNDPDGRKYHAAYFEKYPGVWCHGDFVRITGHGGIVVYGRSDAVLNPGGVRIGTAEIYRQVERLEEVLESLVIGQEWDNDVRVVLFVRLRDGLTLDDELVKKIKSEIRTNTTPRHVPAKVVQVADIPRTKNNKIAELAVRNVVHGQPVRNKEALANPEALELYEGIAELQG